LAPASVSFGDFFSMDERFDLFGDPISEGHGRRGRPAHMWTLKNSNKVKMLLAFGWSTDRIAKAVGITAPTLRKVYFRELKFRDEMRDRLEATIFEELWKGVADGNVGAIKEFRRVLERNDMMLAESALRPRRDQPAPAREPKLGKKETAVRDARTGHEGTGWSTLLRQ
jgi:hypothetical protein